MNSRTPTKPTLKKHFVRVSHYEDPQGAELLRLLAERRGLKTTTKLLRLLIREEARREGIAAG